MRTLSVFLILASGSSLFFSSTAVPDVNDCSKRIERVVAAWEKFKSENDTTRRVDIVTQGETVEVLVDDAEPTENWFGHPPSDKTIDTYLSSAQKAMEAGDMRACNAHLERVQAAIDAG